MSVILITACLDFNPNYTNPKPLVCHPIKESDIPSTDDSVVDAGFFVVSDKLNESAATACVHVGYKNWYSCGGQTIDDHSFSFPFPKLLYDMSGQIYYDVSAYDQCLNRLRLKEGTEEFENCVKEVSG
jgi:hypothetical protein